MPGTTIGGQKAAATNKLRHGEDFYRNIGAKGGKNGHTGGFYADRELAKRVGKIGGHKSRRGPALYKLDTTEFAEGFNAPSWKDRVLRRIR